MASSSATDTPVTSGAIAAALSAVDAADAASTATATATAVAVAKATRRAISVSASSSDDLTVEVLECSPYSGKMALLKPRARFAEVKHAMAFIKVKRAAEDCLHRAFYVILGGSLDEIAQLKALVPLAQLTADSVAHELDLRTMQVAPPSLRIVPTPDMLAPPPLAVHSPIQMAPVMAEDSFWTAAIADAVDFNEKARIRRARAAALKAEATQKAAAARDAAAQKAAAEARAAALERATALAEQAKRMLRYELVAVLNRDSALMMPVLRNRPLRFCDKQSAERALLFVQQYAIHNACLNDAQLRIVWIDESRQFVPERSYVVTNDVFY